MNQHGDWSSYTGSGALILALVLLVIVGVLAFLAMRLRTPLATKRPGKALGSLIVVIFAVSALDFLTAAGAYATVLLQQPPNYVASTNHITPFTFTGMAVTFFPILALTPRRGFKSASGSAVVGAIAAPLVFEMPFDLIVMWRTFPPNPAALYTLLYFFPLILVELSGFAMLLLSRDVRLTRYTLFLLAGMFLVFAIWAVFGFDYPGTALPIALNVISKYLAFGAVISLFVPQRGPTPVAVAVAGLLRSQGCSGRRGVAVAGL